MTPELRVAVNLVAAAICGLAIGWERSWAGRPAGLRTHLLLALGAATLMSMAAWPTPIIAPFPHGTFQMDLARLVQGVMTGVGFIGGGVIMKEGVSLYGLTSAASIWICSAIGIVCGLGYLEIGGGVTIVTLVALTFLRRAELGLPRQVYVLARFTFDAAKAPTQEALAAWLRDRDARIDHISVTCDGRDGTRQYRGTTQVRREEGFRALDRALHDYDGLLAFEMARNNK